MKVLTVRVGERLAARLASAVGKRGRSRSVIVREALEAHLGEASGPTCFDLGADLAGCLDGPRDLSSSARHMKGYGR